MITNDSDTIGLLAGSAVVSALVGGVISNWHSYRLKRKELIASATRSALARVEMYYRIRRRTDDRSDQIKIRDSFHSIQADNDYYISLLYSESPWLGDTYVMFIAALKKETMPLLQQAWDESPMGPSAKLENTIKPNHVLIEKYRNQFATDSKRYFNPLARSWMWLRYTFRKFIKDNRYG